MKPPSTDEKNKRHPWFLPMGSAVLLHFAFIMISMFILLPGFPKAEEQSAVAFRLRSVDAKPQASARPGLVTMRDYSKKLKFMGDKAGTEVQPVTDVSVEPLLQSRNPLERRMKEDKEGALVKRKGEEKSPGKNRDLETILLESQEHQARENVAPAQVSVTNKQLSSAKLAASKPVDEEGLLEVFKKPLASIKLHSPSNLSIDPEEGMPGFTPTSREAAGQGSYLFELGQGVQESPGDLVKYESLDEFLDIEVYTYEDYKTREKYFMIKIFAKKGKKQFHVMPKEIIFTIDSSLSISPDRLEEVKKGIQYCLTHLNKDDLFNIVAFKDTTSFFSQKSVPATAETIKAAEKFVLSLTSSQRTDVYLAFKNIVALSLARVPSNVLLISDGRPTHGVVNSREVINGVTKVNKKTRPVFAFSGGAKVNRYLLDFVSYQNRGWSQFIKRTSDIDAGLAQFYDKIKDPIFLNLRYRLNNLNESEVFPRSLPDFYANAEFTLFGSYQNEDAFSMQLLGDVDGKTKELIFSRSLNEAKKGTEEIMRGWAFNKIYHLISRMTEEGQSPALRQEISDLSAKYGITTPYSPELEKTD